MRLLIKICCVIVLIVAPFIWWDQGSKHVYYFSDGKCFTIWKRVGGKCYFIPRKYHGITAPNDEYILTTTESSLGIIDDRKSPDKIIVEDSSCHLVQEKSDVIVFYNDDGGSNKQFYSLYTHPDGHYRTYNADLEFYTIDISEMSVETNIKKLGVNFDTSTFSTWSIVLSIIYVIVLFASIVVVVFELMDKLRKKQ